MGLFGLIGKDSCAPGLPSGEVPEVKINKPEGGIPTKPAIQY